MSPTRLPVWFVLTLAIALFANVLASITTGVTIDLMRGPSEFASQVRQYELSWLPLYNSVAYPVATGGILVCLWPVLRYFQRSAGGAPALAVQRRVIGAPLMIAAVGFAPWFFAPVFFSAPGSFSQMKQVMPL